MASKLRLAASLLAVVALVLLGTTVAIAANGNGNGNVNANGQANGNGNGNGQENSNDNGNGNDNENENSNDNGNDNDNSNENGNENSNDNEDGNVNGNGNGQENGNGNGGGQENGNGGGDATVTVCHNPSTDASTIVVNASSVPAHLIHGDNLGACAAPPVDEDEGESQDEHEPTDEETDEGQGYDAPEQDPAPTALVLPTGPAGSSPGETRSLYCSTHGPVDRGNGEGPGVALNLPESQGAPLVEKGLVTPGIFYAGIGVSCDALPGYVFAGFWVDHVGEVVSGVSVYPYYVPAS